MAQSKDAWRQIINQLSKTTALDPDNRHHKPTLEEFELEDYNLNALYKSRKRFIENKNERIVAVGKERPKPVKGTFSWEGYVALAFMFAMVTYQGFAKNPTWVIFGFLALGSLFWFFFYYVRRRQKTVAYKAKNKELDEKLKRIDTEEYEHEAAYENLVNYARAVYEYEAWTRRSKPSFWKESRYEDIVIELISMFQTYDMDAYDEFRRFISLVYEEDDGQTCGLWVATNDPVSLKDVEDYCKAIARNELETGIIIGMKGFNNDAKTACKLRGIESWGVDDIIKFEKDIEKAYSDIEE